MAEPQNTFYEDRRRFWILTAVILVVLLMLAVAGWLGRSAYRHFKEKREQAQAQAFLAKGDYRSALLSARQTLQFNPTNVPACRVMAALAELSHSPAALDWQRRIVQTEPSIGNKLLLAAAGLRYQNPPFPLTAQILDELAVTATNLASYQVVAASLALSTRRLADAEAHFETAARLEPTNRLYELNLAVIRLGMTNETKAVQSRAVLEKMRTDGNLSTAALRALVVDRLAHQDAAAANRYSIQLLASPQANLADQLQQLGILQQLKSGDFAARLQSVQRLAATNAPAVASVAAWMRANHLPAESLTWLTGLPDGARAQSPVRLALADGYLQSSDWPKLRDFASQDNWDEMEFLRRALVSRAWSQLGVRQVAESNWGSAVTEAGSRFGALTTLLGLAEQWKLPREQADLLQRMVAQFPRERWAQQALKQAQHSLEQLYLAAGNTAALNQLYVKLFSIFPQDAEIKNNLAATCLLLKTNLPQACQWAAEVYAGTTNDRVVASTYAFALHLQGRTKEGLAILRQLDGRLLQQPDVALYYGVLLAATGATNEAAPFLQIARSNDRLLPEEKQLLEQAGPVK
jgi:tetratricopeptide (TPR) repeat protein